MYSVPEEFHFRLHHCRPRFKDNIENVLLFISSEICCIGQQHNADFAEKLNSALIRFPGNTGKAIKTINNWRTEISSLLGLIEYHNDGTSSPSEMAKILDTEQDLIKFFRFFCFKFQYPGGHLKPERTHELLSKKVKFKPVPYILGVLKEGAKVTKHEFGISKEEATHCIFDDLRVTRDHRLKEDTLSLILENRSNKLEYNSSGDVIRYAGDILDYMLLANIVTKRSNGRYYLKTHEVEVIDSYLNDNEYFPLYESFYGDPKLTIKMVSETQKDWFKYVNKNLDNKVFKSDILSMLEDSLEIEPSTFTVEMIDSLRRKQSSERKVRTKDIGDTGEAITIRHEQIRLSNLGRKDLIKKIVKMPESLSAGYDINSYEGEAEIKRLIEVKTTISKNKLSIQRFHMTPNEWGSASTFGDAYYIYRLMISSDDISLFIIRNPVRQYKNDLLEMTPRDGVEISYNDQSGYYETTLV